MKLYLNLSPEKARQYIAVCLLAGFMGANGQQTNLIHDVYNNETEIKGIQSVTLKDGFYIPAGKTVRIFTMASFKECIPFLNSLSADQNYVSTKIFKVPKVTAANIDSARSTCEVNQTVQYFDGLGRPLQTVIVQGSKAFKDVVQPIAYDALGREQFKYLSYADPGTAGGAYKANALSSGQGVGLFYNPPGSTDPQQPNGIVRTEFPFAETRFEASPLNRVLEQGAAGASWQLSAGHTQRTVYWTNMENEVKLWNLTSNGATSSGSYLPGTLYKTVTKDENWNHADGKSGTVEEFKDLEGRVILKRTYNTAEAAHSTYYVYDDLDNLRYVLPPAVNDSAPSALSSFTEDSEVFKQFIYGYHYDGHKRVIEKKIPGKGWEDMVYNKRDQLVLSRDAEQRNNGKWRFRKYDALSRLVMTGIISSNKDRGGWQTDLDTHANNQLSLWEKRDNTNATLTHTGYTNDALPAHSLVESYLTINYYDDYDFYGNGFLQPNGTTQMLSARIKGLQTGSFVYKMGSNSIRYLSVNYYDEKGQIIRTSAENHLGGQDHTDNTWSFAGELIASMRTHTGSSSGPATTIVTRYDYDHMGRKLATMQSINGQPEVVLSKLTYNEVGQLLKKELHGKDNNGIFLQQTGYAYNERGWLNNSNSDQFSERLRYDAGTYPQYNGNIAHQDWGTGSSYPNIYTYSYDKLDRLLSGTSTGVTMSEVLTYDVMGNIKTLSRDNGIIATYNYTGNRLDQIVNGPLATAGYAYDLNGNAKTDGRNGVAISYNILNLPLTVTKAGLSMAYTYDATGRKLSKVSNMEATSDYVNGIHYSGSGIEFIMTEEGKARNNAGTYSYEYNLSDHLGNVRYSFNQHPTTGLLQRLQSDDYYAFGLRKSVLPISGNNKYLYNGKELQEELGQLDYGARFYDPVIGRWNVVDPLAKDYDDVSPYNYALNNPSRFIDPDGRGVEDKIDPPGKKKPISLEEVNITAKRIVSNIAIPISVPITFPKIKIGAPPLPNPFFVFLALFFYPNNMNDPSSDHVYRPHSLNSQSKKTVDELKKEKTHRGKTGGKGGEGTEVYDDNTNEGMDRANKDFDDVVVPGTDRPFNGRVSGRTGKTNDGKTVTVRDGSSEDKPTLEIYNPSTQHKETKIRY